MHMPSERAPVCIVGAGYVGIVTAAGLASRQFPVRVVEIDETRRGLIARGQPTVFEPGLNELVAEVSRDGRLHVAAGMADGVRGSSVIVIAVGTPPTIEGDADLSQVRDAVAEAVEYADPGTVIAIKSTVPPGTTAALAKALPRRDIAIVMCPEFLREGSALHDFHHPARLVVGGDDPAACRRVASLFADLGGEAIICDSTSAELIKYGSNAFLATKISFINEIARLCELTGANVDNVARGMGLDPRVGSAFLQAGLGWGGSCFPKDVRALDAVFGYHGHTFWLLKAVIESNVQQRRHFVSRIREALGGNLEGKNVTVLGLAFKPGTDDMRQAPSVDIIKQLHDMGAHVVATDPVAEETARPLLAATRFTADPYEALRGADVAVLVTEWPQFIQLDWTRAVAAMRGRVIVDGRNCLDGQRLAALGIRYVSVGRRPVLPPD
jgi:UDPglucose 6-dehydrogenase